jgi:hypothetical protein
VSDRRHTVASSLAVALSLGALALTGGCGADEEGEPIPQDSAARLNERLGEIEGRFDAGGGACADLEDSRRDVQNELDELPNGVDQDTRDALEESFERLFAIAIEDCDEEKGQTTQEAPPPPAPIPQPTQTQETQTQDTQPTEPQEQDEKPKKQDRGEDGGGGNDSNDPGTGGTPGPDVGED